MFFGTWRGYQQAMARERSDNLKDMAIAFRAAQADKKAWKEFLDG